MKIAGVAGGKHPHLKKGDAIQLPPSEKLKSMAKEEVVKASPGGVRRLATKAELIGEPQVIAGRNLKGKVEPSQFIGVVKVTYRTLRLADDRLFPEKQTTIKLHCKDCLDDMGVPDIETVTVETIK